MLKKKRAPGIVYTNQGGAFERRDKLPVPALPPPVFVEKYYRFTGIPNMVVNPLVPRIDLTTYHQGASWTICLSGDGLTVAVAGKPGSAGSFWKTTNLHIYRRPSKD